MFQKAPSPSPNACFRCNKVGHYASQCPTRSLHIGELKEQEPEPNNEDVEEEVYEAEPDLIEEYEGDEEEFDQVGVVRCILTQTQPEEDWHRTSILQTFVKFGNKVCKIIIDSGSCVNAIATETAKSLGLTLVPHPDPYKVSWIIPPLCQSSLGAKS